MAVFFSYQGTPFQGEGPLSSLPHAGEGYFIVNGFTVPPHRQLREGDEVYFVSKGDLPPYAVQEKMLAARLTPGLYEKVKRAKVAIAGLGGLGSHIALFLARTGVGELFLVDDDTVDLTNINRQNYTFAQIGLPKPEATKAQITAVNPFLTVKTAFCQVTGENAPSLFAQYPIVCEAFDDPSQKAALVNALLEHTNCTIVAASGMAGMQSANQIHTRRAMKQLYLCGDETEEAREGQGLMASRVAVCAGHQTHMVLRLIQGEQEP